MRVDVYLNYGGNCEQAFRFYEQHLGAKVTFMMKHGEAPEAGKPPSGLEGKVLHSRMELGGAVVLGADVQPDRFQPMRSAYLTIHADSSAQAEKLYALLTDGGEIFMKMEETFFATRFAMLRDKFGTSWMLLHDRPMPNS